MVPLDDPKDDPWGPLRDSVVTRPPPLEPPVPLLVMVPLDDPKEEPEDDPWDPLRDPVVT